MKNLINAVKESVGLRNGKLIFGYEGTLFYMVKPLIFILYAVISSRFFINNWEINRILFVRITDF